MNEVHKCGVGRYQTPLEDNDIKLAKSLEENCIEAYYGDLDCKTQVHDHNESPTKEAQEVLYKFCLRKHMGMASGVHVLKCSRMHYRTYSQFLFGR